MIDWKEGAVCYAVWHQWKEGDILPSDSGSIVKAHLPTFLKSSDFQLNQPREGWYIPKSELDTEEKYNKAVEVFGLFGYEQLNGTSGFRGIVNLKANALGVHENGVCQNLTSRGTLKTKCTYDQLMTIGELKRKMDERGRDKNKSEFFNAMIEANPNLAVSHSEGAIDKSKRRNKSKQAYDILKGLDYEYDLVKQQWYKKEWV